MQECISNVSSHTFCVSLAISLAELSVLAIAELNFLIAARIKNYWDNWCNGCHHINVCYLFQGHHISFKYIAEKMFESDKFWFKHSLPTSRALFNFFGVNSSLNKTVWCLEPLHCDQQSCNQSDGLPSFNSVTEEWIRSPVPTFCVKYARSPNDRLAMIKVSRWR